MIYAQLRALVEGLLRRDLLIVVWDWNGQTGPALLQITANLVLKRPVRDTGKLCQIIRKVSIELSSLSDSVHDVNVVCFADKSAKVKPWSEHFEYLLNHDT
ncbi:unnamed protein product [Dibothriocephalus latus]|uniref:Uncharacterized protein n=1 Tax=Dibothriocephalus latus TaxID=60516 RepID=A0A3P6USU1_DIBLA|nr:unnamed protein product [Dibothriocephalus latus]